MIIRLLRSVVTFFFEIAETAILAILIFLALYLFLVRPHQIRGDSMLPNFRNGEYLLTEMVSYNLLKKEPQRGEAVRLRAPEQHNLDFTDRINPLPKEKVKLENGKV